MRRIMAMLIAASGVVLIVFLALVRSGAASVSTTFIRCGSHWGQTNETFAFFAVSNSGSRRLFFHGVADSCSRLWAQALAPEGWVDTRPWAFDPHTFYLSPGRSREVAVRIETNLPWKVCFRFRETGFVDHCPDFIWWRLPSQLRHEPAFHTSWTDPMPAYVAR